MQVYVSYSQLPGTLVFNLLNMDKIFPHPPIRLSYSPLFRHVFNVSLDPLYGFLLTNGIAFFPKKNYSPSFLSISMHKVRCYLKLHSFDEIRHVLVWLKSDLFKQFLFLVEYYAWLMTWKRLGNSNPNGFESLHIHVCLACIIIVASNLK